MPIISSVWSAPVITKQWRIATIEATEAAASVKMFNNRLSRPEFWHPRFSTHTLLDSTTVRNKIEYMDVVLSRTGAYGDMVPYMVLDHYLNL